MSGLQNHNLIHAASRGSVTDVEACLHRLDSTTPSEASMAEALFAAAIHGHADVIRSLLARQPGLLRTPSSSGMRPATVAASQGHLEVMKAIGEVDPTVLSEVDHTGQNALHHAAALGDPDLLEYLARIQPDSLEMPSAADMTPMDLAWNLGHDECVSLLERHGVERLSSKWACGCSPGEACGPT